MWNCLECNCVYRPLSIIVGAILVVAGLLKLYDHADSALSPGLVALTMEVEVGLGLWMISGIHAMLARRTALVVFLGFVAVSFAQIFAGEASCGCFGSVPIRPWQILTFDLFVVVALFMTVPGKATTLPFPSRKLWCLSLVYLSVSALAAIYLVNSTGPIVIPSPHQISLGSLPQGGKASATFWLINQTARPVEISNVRSTCDCLAVDLPQNIVPPFASVCATANLDLRDEAHFSGSLGIEVIGITPRGHRAFRMLIRAVIVPSN
ncbi:MAG: DUF1573 domain-containing protein [Acidobacteria bacterium]|nr:DUF1573 domain-containing protein [Acidobacteriota bacterium]